MAENGAPQEMPAFAIPIPIPAPTPTPEFYTDATRVGMSPYTVALYFGVTSDGDRAVRPAAVLRMSPLHAKVLVIVLKRLIKQAETEWGTPIVIPEKLAKERDIVPERDW